MPLCLTLNFDLLIEEAATAHAVCVQTTSPLNGAGEGDRYRG